jgi:hypothetical protein
MRATALSFRSTRLLLVGAALASGLGCAALQPVKDGLMPLDTGTDPRRGDDETDAVSETDETDVTITPGDNNRPRAVINTNPEDLDELIVGDTLFLDASESTDLDPNDILLYQWELEVKPSGSSATIINAQFASATLDLDKAGEYRVKLTVSDDFDDDSKTVRFTVASGNGRPTANAGQDQTVNVGSLVQLSGALSSDPDGDPLTYDWNFLSGGKPSNSAAQLAGTSVQPAISPRFSPDVAGVYQIQLIVEDDSGERSAPDVVIIVARDQSGGSVGGSASGSSSSSGGDCLSCAEELGEDASIVWTAGDAAGGFGLLALPLLALLTYRKSDDDLDA